MHRVVRLVCSFQKREAALEAVRAGRVKPDADDAHVTQQGDLSMYTEVGTVGKAALPVSPRAVAPVGYSLAPSYCASHVLGCVEEPPVAPTKPCPHRGCAQGVSDRVNARTGAGSTPGLRGHANAPRPSPHSDFPATLP